MLQSSAQTTINDETIKNNLLNIHELKLKYEGALSNMLNSRLTRRSEVDECRAALASYTAAVNSIKSKAVRSNYLAYLNKTIKTAGQSGVNSIKYRNANLLDTGRSKNDLTYVEYLKIVRYCIFVQNKYTLSATNAIPPYVLKN